ncbi:hypothetical protein ACFQX6_12255 [Streptosporangium lutulentum]
MIDTPGLDGAIGADAEQGRQAKEYSAATSRPISLRCRSSRVTSAATAWWPRHLGTPPMQHAFEDGQRALPA